MQYSTVTMKYKDDNVNLQGGNSKSLDEKKSKYQAYFNNDNFFYYLSYNDIYDFSSGYSLTSVDVSKTSVDYISTEHNSESPLSFLDNVEIEEMNFISGTKYVYYKIYNKNQDKYFYGLIDVELNKVLYNFQEEITTFIPYIKNGDHNTGEMLAITKDSAYKICIIKSGDSCLSSCTGTNFIRDPDGNKCQENCDSGKIRMMPEDICIKKELCDLNIFIMNSEETKCGLCSYFYPNDNKYKLINITGCLGNIPNNSEYYNEKLYLLKCKENYHIKDNECIPNYCYTLCSTCYDISDNPDEQKCLSCKNNNYILENGNCVYSPTTIIITPTTTVANFLTSIITAPQTMVISNLPTSTMMPEIPSRECKNKRCYECNKESDAQKLCMSCDEAIYKKVNYTKNYSKFFDCIEESKLQTNYYHDINDNQYKPCFQYCKKCSGSGNATVQNCLECDINYMPRPGYNPYNNCVAYSKYYYLSPYDEYKPLANPQCPKVAKYLVKDEVKNETYCIYDCQANRDYKYLYNGNCYKSCSQIEGTSNENYICKETEINKIYISEKNIYIDTNDTINIIQTLAMSYAEEFNYTVNHISLYKNEEITVALYKNETIIGDTNLTIPNINFGDCYEKVKSYYNITQKLIIGIIEKKVKNNPYTFYLFFHPISGIKLETENICKNETIELKENLYSMLDEKNENYDMQKALMKQGINIFDINDHYYKDICYDFENPKNRDMALKDRVKETYVNVTLCDEGCTNTGIDMKNNAATCNCKFNEITNNDLIHENAALEYLVGELFDLINSSNILVLKCFKYIFRHFLRSKGSIIILVLFISNIIFFLLFIFYELNKMKKYIFSLTKKFVSFISKYPELAIKINPPKRSEIKNKTKQTRNFINESELEKKK